MGLADVSIWKLLWGITILAVSIFGPPPARTIITEGVSGMVMRGVSVVRGCSGDQNYDIPADLELGDVRSIVIYCMPFHFVFSVAPLSAP